MPSLALLLFAATGLLTLIAQPRGIGLVVVIAFGALIGFGRVLFELPSYLRITRVTAGLIVAVLSGAAIYVMSRWELPFGLLALVLSAGFTTLSYFLIPLGALSMSPFGRWRKAEKRRPHEFAFIVMAALAAALAFGFAAHVGGGNLPGVALGSSVVLRVERAAALFGASLVVFTVLAYAWKGILPSEFSSKGFRYEQLKDTTQASLGSLEETNQQFTVSIAQAKQEIAELRKRLGEISPEIGDSDS